jgi:hypothetical protein
MLFLKKNYLTIIFFLIAQIYILLANSHLMILASHAPPGSRFTYNHLAYWAMDHNVYLSVITQGKNGEWMMRDAYTTEPTNPTPFYFFYIALGKVSAVLNLQPDTVYVAAKILGAEVFLLMFFAAAVTLLGIKFGFLAAVFSLAVTTSPTLLFSDPELFWKYTPWWMRFDAIQRLDIMPHYLWGWTLGITAIICLDRLEKTAKSVWPLILVPVIILAGLFLPSAVLPYAFGLPVVWFVRIIRDTRKNGKLSINPRYTFFMLLVTLSAVFPLFLSWREKWNGFPWNVWYADDLRTWNIGTPGFNREMLAVWGILPIIALPAVISSLKKFRPVILFLTVWAAIPYLLLPFAGILSIAKYRLVSAAPFIPLSILSGLTVKNLWNSGKGKIISIIALVIFGLTSLPVSGYMLYHMIRFAREYPVYNNVYLPEPLWNMYSYINANSPQNSVFIGDWVGGNLLPAFSHVISYAGHPQHTRDFFNKTGQYTRFYGGLMAETEARSFVRLYGINYVLYTPAEQRMSSRPFPYPFLTEVFRDGDYILYRVKD